MYHKLSGGGLLSEDLRVAFRVTCPDAYTFSDFLLHMFSFFHRCYLYTVSQKVPIFILSVTSSNINRFSHFCIAGKRMNFATKSIRHYPHHLRRIATLPWKIKNSNFWPPVNCACIPVSYTHLTLPTNREV